MLETEYSGFGINTMDVRPHVGALAHKFVGASAGMLFAVYGR